MIQKIVVAAALAAMSTAAFAQQSGIATIQGRWSEDRTGEILVITPTRFGIEGWTSWGGAGAVTGSGGYKGSQVKIESQLGRCFYRVSVNQDNTAARKITLGLIEGNPICPQSGVWSGVY